MFVRKLYVRLWWRRCAVLTPLPIPMSVSWRRPSAIHRDASRWCAEAPVVSLLTCKNQYIYTCEDLLTVVLKLKGQFTKNHLSKLSFFTVEQMEFSRIIFGCSFSEFKQWSMFLTAEDFFFFFFFLFFMQRTPKYDYILSRSFFMYKHYILCKKNSKHDIIIQHVVCKINNLIKNICFN